MSGNAITVFIVDDHPLVREWLGQLLRMEPDLVVVGEADEPGSAMIAIERLRPHIAVVDLSLKRGSGLDLLKRIRAEVPATRTVVLSMHEEMGDIVRAFRAGAKGYVMKQESTGQIVSAIRQVHAGKVFAASGIQAALLERNIEGFGNSESTPEAALSDREMEVFRRLGAGQSTRRIADELGVSQKTVQTYCMRIKEKLGLAVSTDLFKAAFRHYHEKGSKLT